MFVSDLNEHHLNSVFKTSHLFLSYDLTFWLCFKCLQFGLKKSCEQQTSLLCHLRNDDQLSEWLRPQWVAPGFLLIFSLQYFFPVSSWILVCKPWGRGRKCIFIEVRSQTRCTEILDSISHFLQKQMAPKVWWVSPVCFFFFFFHWNSQPTQRKSLVCCVSPPLGESRALLTMCFQSLAQHLGQCSDGQ